MNTSITAAYIFNSNNNFSDANGYDKPYNIVFSADYALAPGLVLAGDVAYFDLDQKLDTGAPVTRAMPPWAASPSRSEPTQANLLVTGGWASCPAALVFWPDTLFASRSKK